MSEFSLTFDPVFPVPMIFAFALPGLVLLFWLELKKKQKFFVFRMAAVLLLLIAILGLVLQPSLPSEKKGALLLTARYEKSKVDSVLRFNPDLKILRTETAAPFPNSVQLPSNLSSSNENIDYIFGEGLPESALERLIHWGFAFFPSPLPQGVLELNVPEIFAGRKNLISGIFNARQKTKLKLVGPTGIEDSLFIDGKTESFSLSVSPRQPGLFSYDLITEDSLGNKVAERLPMEVKPEIKLRIFFLQEFPSAEFRYLKNFLAEKGHVIVVRTRTSKDNFNEEFIGAPKIQLNISSGLLNRFDLLVADAKAMENLNATERANLEQAVKNGLGLMTLQDKPTKKSEFYLIATRDYSGDTTHVWVANKKYILPSLPVEIKKGPELKSVFENKKRILAGYRFLGAGRIGFQLLQETYRIALEGNTNDYAALWSPLIEKVARKKIQDFEIKMDAFFPYYMDEPLAFSILSGGKTPEVFFDDIKIPLQENVAIDDYWHGKIWARNSGWHQLRAADSTIHNYFIHGSLEWKSVRSTRLIKQTLLAQSESQQQSQLPQRGVKRVPPILFYLLFLLAAGFLWLAPKI